MEHPEVYREYIMGRIKAILELTKLGNIGTIREEVNAFFRGNIVNTFKDLGFFDYLKTPHSISEIASNYGFTDFPFLKQILNVFVSDETLQNQADFYSLIEPLNINWSKPKIFEESLVDLFISYAKAIPQRLAGNYINFTSGINLYNWDDALVNKMYTQIRRSAFSFADIYKKPLHFLDIGCGNGYTTTCIWYEFFKKGFFTKNSPMKIIGTDPDIGLLKIAKDEFVRRIQKMSNMSDAEIGIYQEFFPTFEEGNIEKLPYENDSFDAVYASQVLHWTDSKKSFQEMTRITKKNGKIFGTENMYPSANPYNDLHFKVVKGAQGFFSKLDFKKWGTELGVQEIKFATPITIFLITK